VSVSCFVTSYHIISPCQQTGGPDGDLGSNEIKLGHERTIAIVDGSGVLYDANGIDINELRRLANEKPRQPVSEFDADLISSDVSPNMLLLHSLDCCPLCAQSFDSQC